MNPGPVVGTVYKPVVGGIKHGDPVFDGVTGPLYAALATKVDIPVSQGLEDLIEEDLQSRRDVI